MPSFTTPARIRRKADHRRQRHPYSHTLLVLSNAVDPGWVATKMGGASAPDDFEEGYLTQTWLAVSEDPAATVSGRYWHHRRPLPPAKEVEDPVFQDQLSARLAEMTGVSLF